MALALLKPRSTGIGLARRPRNSLSQSSVEKLHSALTATSMAIESMCTVCTNKTLTDRRPNTCSNSSRRAKPKFRRAKTVPDALAGDQYDKSESALRRNSTSSNESNIDCFEDRGKRPRTSSSNYRSGNTTVKRKTHLDSMCRSTSSTTQPEQAKPVQTKEVHDAKENSSKSSTKRTTNNNKSTPKIEPDPTTHLPDKSKREDAIILEQVRKTKARIQEEKQKKVAAEKSREEETKRFRENSKKNIEDKIRMKEELRRLIYAKNEIMRRWNESGFANVEIEAKV